MMRYDGARSTKPGARLEPGPEPFPLEAMLSTALLACVPFVLHQAAPIVPTPEQIAATCTVLEKALGKEAELETATTALRSALAVVDARVIAVIDEKGLRHDDLAVRGAAVEALARMDHPAALDALHAAFAREKKQLQEAPPRHAAYLRAIARHGKERSIPLLVEDLFQSPDRGVVTARILGLGNIRSPKSVEELVRLMRSSPRPRVGDHMGEFRLALVALTAADMGTDQELWINWYGDHKTRLEVAAEPAELPPELRRRWNAYWGITEEKAGPGGKRRREK